MDYEPEIKNGRAGKCPVCDRSRLLPKLEITIDGKLWYVYICNDCQKMIKKKLVEPF